MTPSLLRRTTPAHTAWASIGLLVLASGVLAAPPTVSPNGISGSFPARTNRTAIARVTPTLRPRAATFLTKPNPDPRAAVAQLPVKPVAHTLSNIVEVFILAPQRPVRARLTILVEGKNVTDVWLELLRKAYTYFDRDKDGYLNSSEVITILSNAGMSLMLQNGVYQPTPQDRPTLERLDTDGDRKISFDEYVAYYKGATSHILRPQLQVNEDPYNTATTEALFKLFDTNKDDKLTRDEVNALEKLLATKDSDEDECLSQVELMADPTANRGRVVMSTAFKTPKDPRTPPLQTVLTYPLGRVPGTLTQQVIRKYDKNEDLELTAEECGFPAADFTQLDTDGNGRLDGEELDAWRTGTPDLEVTLSVANKPDDRVAKVTTADQEARRKGFEIQQIENSRLILRCGRQPIAFSAFGTTVTQLPPLKAQYRHVFDLPAGKKGYVEEKDLSGPNAVQFQYLRTIFDPADADADKKLTLAEFESYFDLQDSFRNVALSVMPAIQTPTLFQLLDGNQDGRLGVRELRTAWERLHPLEPTESGVISRAAIQPTINLTLARGMERYSVNQSQQYQQNQQNLPDKGPLWFRKMDRNADGDLSRMEYLGARAEFDTIDTDHDELISLTEAEAYDKKLRGRDKK